MLQMCKGNKSYLHDMLCIPVNIITLLHELYIFEFKHANDSIKSMFAILIPIGYIKFHVHTSLTYEILFMILFKHLHLISC